jgi:hypothetical protein
MYGGGGTSIAFMAEKDGAVQIESYYSGFGYSNLKIYKNNALLGYSRKMSIPVIANDKISVIAKQGSLYHIGAKSPDWSYTISLENE